MARPRYQNGSLVVRGKPKRYVLRWKEDVVKQDGTIQRIQHGETIGLKTQFTREQALEILRTRVNACSQQQTRLKLAITLSEFVRAEWKPSVGLAVRESSVEIYSFNLERHVLPALGDLPVRELRTAHVEARLSQLRAKGYSTSTLRSVRAAFSSVLKAAVKHGLVERNHAHGVCIREADSRKERRFYSLEQVRALFQAMSEPCASVVSMAVLTGMRIGEILALRWRRVDLLGGTLEIAESYSKGRFGPPKTKSSRRFIPISSALRRVLEAQHERMNPTSPEELVFQTAKRSPLNDKNLYNRELAPACDRIRLPRVSWHSFRHTHATLLHDNGESLKTAQALLGHSDLETTLNVYTHAVSDSQRNAVERVAEVLFSDFLSGSCSGRPN